LSPKGCLFTYKNSATGTVDVSGMRDVLLLFWNAVSAQFPDAWGLPPTRSRLMHGAGIRAMGRVMDHVMRSVAPDSREAASVVARELRILRPVCHWTGGAWTILDGVRWNEIQNVPSHVRALGDALVRAYLSGRNGR
jgi:hypothetical protein